MDMFGRSGGYRRMDAYVLAWIIELATDSFCENYLNFKNDPQGKTSAQMNHAARSGCRNFAEGSERLMTSHTSAMDQLNVAVGSLGELRDDYLKWLLRQRHLPWADDDPQAMAIRTIDPDPAPDENTPYSIRRFSEHLLAQYEKFSRWLNNPDSDIRANALIILCIRTAKMQESYVKYVGDEFKREGGFKERAGETRRKTRSNTENLSYGTPPPCPKCGGPTQLKHRRSDNNPFWGCKEYPTCEGIAPVRNSAP